MCHSQRAKILGLPVLAPHSSWGRLQIIGVIIVIVFVLLSFFLLFFFLVVIVVVLGFASPDRFFASIRDFSFGRYVC